MYAVEHGVTRVLHKSYVIRGFKKAKKLFEVLSGVEIQDICVQDICVSNSPENFHLVLQPNGKKFSLKTVVSFQIFDVNVKAAFELTKEVAPHLKK